MAGLKRCPTCYRCSSSKTRTQGLRSETWRTLLPIDRVPRGYPALPDAGPSTSLRSAQDDKFVVGARTTDFRLLRDSARFEIEGYRNSAWPQLGSAGKGAEGEDYCGGYEHCQCEDGQAALIAASEVAGPAHEGWSEDSAEDADHVDGGARPAAAPLP